MPIEPNEECRDEHDGLRCIRFKGHEGVHMNSLSHRWIKFYRTNGEYGFLSNLYKVLVVVDEVEFSSSEHAYQWAKPRADAVKHYIRSAPTGALACIVGHGLFPYMVVNGWTKKKVNRMRACLQAKFTQNLALMEDLLKTGNATLIEESKTDSFWGEGKSGKGKNMLGKLLMELRTELETVTSRPEFEVYEDEIMGGDDEI